MCSSNAFKFRCRWFGNCPPKGDPKRRIRPKNHLKVMCRVMLEPLKRVMFLRSLRSDPPFAEGDYFCCWRNCETSNSPLAAEDGDLFLFDARGFIRWVVSIHGISNISWDALRSSRHLTKTVKTNVTKIRPKCMLRCVPNLLCPARYATIYCRRHELKTGIVCVCVCACMNKTWNTNMLHIYIYI